MGSSIRAGYELEEKMKQQREKEHIGASPFPLSHQDENKPAVGLAERIGTETLSRLNYIYSDVAKREIRQSVVEAVSIVYGDFMTKYKHLVQFYDDHNGTPCEQIRHQQALETIFTRRPLTLPDEALLGRSADERHEPSLKTVLHGYYKLSGANHPEALTEQFIKCFWDDNVIFDEEAKEPTVEELKEKIAKLQDELGEWKSRAKSAEQQSAMKY